MYTDKSFIWYELSQTEVHDAPFPPRSSCDDWLLRLTYIVQRGQFGLISLALKEHAFTSPSRFRIRFAFGLLVHDEPFPPRSSCDDWLLRLTYIVQRGQFEIDRFLVEYDFDTPQVIQESKICVNLYSNDKRYESIENMYSALICMGVDDRLRIVEELSVAIFDGAVPLPQLAIDVTIRKHYCYRSW
ncbi:hypothetical protein M0R45_019984 [Rubus argutus]|uniref:Uncharacterized protein n=1 Tax=Rubus argutus TaxID=59490 RepID=A0AAW1XAE6_RUBAR